MCSCIGGGGRTSGANRSRWESFSPLSSRAPYHGAQTPHSLSVGANLLVTVSLREDTSVEGMLVPAGHLLFLSVPQNLFLPVCIVSFPPPPPLQPLLFIPLSAHTLCS